MNGMIDLDGAKNLLRNFASIHVIKSIDKSIDILSINTGEST